MAGPLLETTYHLTETKTKSVTIGLDSSTKFEPCVWIYKSGSNRIRLSPTELTELLSLGTEIDSYFTAATLKDMQYKIGENLTICSAERFGKRLLYLERAENQRVYLWIAAGAWKSFRNMFPCIQSALNHVISCVHEVKALFDQMGSQVKCILDQQHLDGSHIKDVLDKIDKSCFMYQSSTGMDVTRVINELAVFHIAEFREYVKYSQAT
jgi:hypothetical protein